MLYFALNFSDIALIKLPEPVEFSEVIKPIPIACSVSEGMDVLAIGNGHTSDAYPGLPPILQYTELKTTNLQACLRSFPFLFSRKSVLCVVGEEHKSACRGDSGGPLVTLTPDDALVGLTSFGSKKGCELGESQVFTRVSSFTKWIKEVSGVECKN